MGGGGGGGGAAGADTTDGPWFVDKEIGSLPLLFSEVVSGRNFCSWNANYKTGINNNSQLTISNYAHSNIFTLLLQHTCIIYMHGIDIFLNGYMHISVS